MRIREGVGGAVCILAGGRGRRLGGRDKAFVELAGKPLIAHVMARLRPQASAVVINANGAPSRFTGWGSPIIADSVPDRPGPLAGVLAGMEWAEKQGRDTILTVPVDVPFLPADLLERLTEARRGSEIACAASQRRTHSVIALWPVSLASALRRALTVENVRKVETWLSRHRLGIAEWPVSPYDPFLNINSPQDLIEAERIACEFSI